MEDECRRCMYYAFDHGVTHFDLASNYGPPPGNSEITVGQILKDMPRDELIILGHLNDIARERRQTLAQMALAWTVRLPTVTSALIGASNVEQVRQNVAALDNLAFTDDELARITAITQNWPQEAASAAGGPHAVPTESRRPHRR